MEISRPKHDVKKQEVFRDVIRFEVINSYRHFEELLCLRVQGAFTDGWLHVAKIQGAARTYFRAPSPALS